MAQNSTTALEDSVEKYLVKRVKEFGGFTLKGDRVDGRRFLDRIVIMPGGVTAYVECQRPRRGVVREHQSETLRRLGDMGHPVFLVKSKEEVDECLRTILKRSSGR
jgi:hypothetical protein